MNPDTVTFLVGLAMLAIGIIGTDALTRRARRAKDDEHDREVVAWNAEVDRLANLLASAESDVEWSRIVLADVARERDMFETAFRGELMRQVYGEALYLGGEVGEVLTFDPPARRERSEEPMAEWERQLLQEHADEAAGAVPIRRKRGAK